MGRGLDENGSVIDCVGEESLLLGEHTFMWIDVTEYSLSSRRSAAQVIGDIVASPQYSETFNVAGDGKPSQSTVHFNWTLDEITPALFAPCPASTAEAILQDWADNQRWTDPDFRQPPEAQARVARVREILRSGDVYLLQNPPPARGNSPAIYGLGGFHEFIVIDDPSASAYLIVAADD